MTVTAQQAKTKGNEAFKQGDYAQAVGHYSAAIVADRHDFTLPLNRAAAYLKLDKNEDAERDCTRVLELVPNNAKALFRRGSARLALEKVEAAIQDFEASLKMEPTNPQVGQSLIQARQVLSKQKSKRVSSKKVDSPVQLQEDKTKTSEELLSRARRVVNSDDDETLLTPISTRTLTPSSVPTPSPPAPPSKPSRPSSFKDVQKAREQAKPSRIVPIMTSPAENVPSERPPSEQRRPVSLSEFTRQWNQPAGDRRSLLLSLPPDSLPTLFGACLEPNVLISIVDVLRSVSDISVVTSYLVALGNVPRFQTLILFLAKDEREAIRQLVQTCSSSLPSSSPWHKV